jgi:2Fe-2S ferredoxin
MTTILFKSADGTEQEVPYESGHSIMETAIHNNIDGIEAECGGSCACATCHVYVEAALLDALPAMDDMEHEMLDMTASPRQPNSRLSCQLIVPDHIERITIELPETQY